MNNLLSSEEVKSFLEIEEPDLKGLVQLGRLRAYKIGGAYVRFRKEEVLNVKQELFSKKKQIPSISVWARLRNFWRFNNLYIVSFVVIALLFFFVTRS